MLHDDTERVHFFEVARSFVIKVRKALGDADRDLTSATKHKTQTQSSNTIRTQNFVSNKSVNTPERLSGTLQIFRIHHQNVCESKRLHRLRIRYGGGTICWLWQRRVVWSAYLSQNIIWNDLAFFRWGKLRSGQKRWTEGTTDGYAETRTRSERSCILSSQQLCFGVVNNRRNIMLHHFFHRV